jgi:hypothetical protein
VNLFGGSGVFAGNERAQIDIEQLNIPIIIAAGPNIPPYVLRFASPSYPLLVAAVAATATALTAQVAALTAFLANNPAPNEYVTAGDISDATAALSAASAHLVATSTFATTITTTLSNAVLTARIAALGPSPAGREGFIDVTRTPQLTALVTGTLTRLWGARFIWITTRARMDTGTLAQYANTGQAVTNTTNQIATNAATIADINTVLAAQ